MIHGEDRSPLSKRHGATSVMEYKELGFLPEALINCLIRLGWSHGDQEIFSRAELIEKFTLDNVGKSPSVFSMEKLLWLNAHYIKEKPPLDFVPLLVPFLNARNYPEKPPEYLAGAIRTLQSRSRTLVEMADMIRFYMIDEVELDEAAAKKFLTTEIREPLNRLISELEALEDFSEEKLEAVFRKVMESVGMKLGKIAQPVRVALTGTSVSPGIFEIIDVLGKETVLKRLRKGLGYIEQQ
jgi:glutamyl-tRNA synthetase